MSRFHDDAFRRAKIVATLGPGSASPDTIRLLAQTGVNVFRLNFSHGEHETHERSYGFVRQASEDLGKPLGILADMQGPKIRVGKFTNDGIDLRLNEEYKVVEGHESSKDDTIRRSAWRHSGVARTRRCHPAGRWQADADSYQGRAAIFASAPIHPAS